MSQGPDPRTPQRPAPTARDEGGHGADAPATLGNPSPEERPLPPLPDGGLAAAMPDWLRGASEADGPVGGGGEGDAARPGAEVIDPTTFLADDDLPDWLRRMEVGRRGAVAVGDGAAERMAVAERAVPARTVQTPPAPTWRGAQDPAPNPQGRLKSAPNAGEVAAFDPRSGSPPPGTAPRASEPLRPADRRTASVPGRAATATGGSRALPIGLLLLLVLILVLLVATVR